MSDRWEVEVMGRDATQNLATLPNAFQSATAKARQTLATDIGTIMSLSLQDKLSVVAIVLLKSVVVHHEILKKKKRAAYALWIGAANDCKPTPQK